MAISWVKTQAPRLRAIGSVRAANPGAQGNNATYGFHPFQRRLGEAAKLIRAGLGVRSISIDLGGWDVHNGQGNASTGAMQERVDILAQGLGSFYADFGSQMNEITVVVMSEFGRTIEVNGNGGTDHGRGGITMVLGGAVNGGVHGDFPDVIENGPEGDLPVITDYRQILAEVISKRLDNGANLGHILPGYSHSGDLGIVS